MFPNVCEPHNGWRLLTLKGSEVSPVWDLCHLRLVQRTREEDLFMQPGGQARWWLTLTSLMTWGLWRGWNEGRTKGGRNLTWCGTTNNRSKLRAGNKRMHLVVSHYLVTYFLPFSHVLKLEAEKVGLLLMWDIYLSASMFLTFPATRYKPTSKMKVMTVTD